MDGGLGFVGQFIRWPDQNKDLLLRRTFGGVMTRNGSYGYGFLQSGTAFDGRLAYKFGVGRGEVSLKSYPFGGSTAVGYTSEYDYGVFGSALWDLPDDRFSVGPLLDFRSITASLDVPDTFPDIDVDLDRSLKTAALGLGFHFDDRDNPLSPTKGLNAYVDAKFNDSVFGSDRDFNLYDLEAYYFAPLSESSDFGIKGTLNLAAGDTPFIFMPTLNNRGIPYNRYQGEQAFSTEIELTREVSKRWDVVAFAGYGTNRAGDSRFFDDSDGVWSGGAGFRYLVARKFGLKAGMDIAVGPEDTVVYFQFGHAWSMGMD